MRKCTTWGEKRRVRLGEGRSTLKTSEAKATKHENVLKLHSGYASCHFIFSIYFICMYEVVHNKNKTT